MWRELVFFLRKKLNKNHQHHHTERFGNMLMCNFSSGITIFEFLRDQYTVGMKTKIFSVLDTAVVLWKVNFKKYTLEKIMGLISAEKQETEVTADTWAHLGEMRALRAQG